MGGFGTAQQRNCNRTGNERNHGEGPSGESDAQNASGLLRRPGPDGDRPQTPIYKSIDFHIPSDNFVGFDNLVASSSFPFRYNAVPKITQTMRSRFASA